MQIEKLFEVITAKFEETELETNAYDFIFSASAFHWAPEGIGYKKVSEGKMDKGFVCIKEFIFY